MAMPRREITEEIQVATVITAVETVIGSEIDIRNFSTMTVYIDYTNGDETSYDLIPKVLRVASGDEHPICSWSSSPGTKTVTADKFRMTATGKHYFVLDVRGINIIKLYGDATGGTPTGTAQIGYSLSTD